MASIESSSPYLRRWLHAFRSGGSPLILDLACGGGRNARLLQSIGCRVICADIDHSVLKTIAQESCALQFEGKRADPRLGQLLPAVVDLRDKSWPFRRDV